MRYTESSYEVWHIHDMTFANNKSFCKERLKGQYHLLYIMFSLIEVCKFYERFLAFNFAENFFCGNLFQLFYLTLLNPILHFVWSKQLYQNNTGFEPF